MRPNPNTDQPGYGAVESDRRPILPNRELFGQSGDDGRAPLVGLASQFPRKRNARESRWGLMGNRSAHRIPDTVRGWPASHIHSANTSGPAYLLSAEEEPAAAELVAAPL